MAEEPSKLQWWEKVDWTGAVAFVLAVGVSVSIATALIGGVIGAIYQSRSISEQGASMLSTIFGALIGALATFLGQNRKKE